jgi:hypothetical protein
MAAGTDKSKVRVAVVGDASQLQKELLKAEGQLNGFGANAKKSGDLLRSALFGTAVLYGAKQLVDAAANLEQAVGGTAAVFEQASGPINEFAKNAAKLAGLSEETARTLTSRLGASLKGFGLSAEEAAEQAVFLTQTGADLAATLGGSTDEAVTALGAALRGEFDPLERFGIALKASDIAAKAVSMGLADNASNVSTLAKGQAALALITEKSAFAQGQFGREATTASGQAAIASANTKNASADLGRSFLPIYTKIQEVVSAVAQAFSALPGPVQTGVVALTAVALVGPKIYAGTTLAITAIKAFPAALEKAALSAAGTQQALNGMQLTTGVAGQTAVVSAGKMATLGPVLLAVGAAAVIGGLAYKSYADEQAAVAKDVKELRDTFDDLTGAMTENTAVTVRNNLESRNQLDNLTKAGIGYKQFTDVLDDNRDALVSQGEVESVLRMQLEYGTKATQDRINAIREAGGTQNELIARLIETESADFGLIETLYNGIDAYNIEQEAIKENIVQKALSEGKSRLQAEAEAALQAATEAATKAIKDNSDAMRAARDPYFKVYESVLEIEEAQKEYNETVAKFGPEAAETAEATKKLAEAGFEYFDALSALAVAQGENKASAAELERQFQLLVAAGIDPNSAAMVRLKDKILEVGGAAIFVGGLQPKITIEVEVTEAQRKIRELLGLSETLKGSLSGVGVRFPAGKATGGPVDAGTPYIVGEKGPELFVPSGYGRIMDAFSTNKTLLSNAGGSMGGGGGNVTINVNVSPTADKAAIGQTIVEAISSYERRSGYGWRS